MAKNAPTATASPQAATGRPRQKRSMFYVTLGISAMAMSLPTFMVVAVGMLPTLVAAIVDRNRPRYSAIAVGCTNFAGVVPFVFDLWFEAHTIRGAQALLSDVFVLLTMYSAAAVGWVLVATLPQLFVAIDQILVKREIERLQIRQRELVDEWGREITGLHGEDEEAPGVEGDAGAPTTGKPVRAGKRAA